MQQKQLYRNMYLYIASVAVWYCCGVCREGTQCTVVGEGGGAYSVHCGRGEGGYTVYCGRGRGVLSVLW